MRRRLSKAVIAIAAITAIAGCGNPDGDGQRTEVTVSPVTTVASPAPTTAAAPETVPPAPTTTQPDLTGVDWVGLARLTYGKCGEWHDLAIQVGWPEEEWAFLSKVIWRESRCKVDSWNGADAGLTQINKVHKKWLSEMGWNHPDDMFDAEKNLTFALYLWESSGWKPWRFSGPVPD